jgi:hypothetical protein
VDISFRRRRTRDRLAGRIEARLDGNRRQASLARAVDLLHHCERRAAWTGIGAVGAFTVGIVAFGDQASAMRMVSIALIVAGIVGLKLA